MRYEVEVGGRIRQLVVTRADDGFAVSIDGHPVHVNAARIDKQTLSLLVDDGRQQELTIVPESGTPGLTVGVGAVRVPVLVNGRRRRRRDVGAAVSGPQRVTAPMPGKVVRVLVAPGDAVRARQPLVVIEAMKMENELRATHDGAVADVPVREGMSVEAGALLVVIA
jgi:biotin carboxyl carrier protein